MNGVHHSHLWTSPVSCGIFTVRYDAVICLVQISRNHQHPHTQTHVRARTKTHTCVPSHHRSSTVTSLSSERGAARGAVTLEANVPPGQALQLLLSSLGIATVLPRVVAPLAALRCRATYVRICVACIPPSPQCSPRAFWRLRWAVTGTSSGHEEK